MKTLKIYASAFVLMLAFNVTTSVDVAAQDAVVESAVVKTNPNKELIDAAKLPAAVKEAIEDSDLEEWKIEKAYEITYTDDLEKVEYEIHFENAKKQNQIKLYDSEGDELELD